MSDTEELNVGDFNPSTYEHVLPEGAHDFNDYDSDYAEQHPELGFTDEQVEAEVAKLDPDDKKFYEEYREFLDTYYRQHGKIIEMPDLIKLIMTGWYPEIPSTTRKEQDADDLSCITIDSMKHIDNDKVKEIWAGMAKIKHQEGEYYEQLAGMVDEMMPEVVYQSMQATPRPSTNVPACADELLQELGSEEFFKRVLATGYMVWQGFEKNRRKRLREKYKPNTICEVAAKFGISTSRLMDLRRGAAINREDTQCSKMLKAKKKEETEGKTPTGSCAASPEEQATPQPSTSKE